MNTGNMTIREYTDALFSKASVPGGGGASALTGALSACLAGMVGSLTVGKKRYAAAEPEVKRCMEELKESAGRFLALSDKDAEVFEPLSKAYSMPSGTEEEKAEKARVMEGLLRDAAEVPLLIMEEAEKVLEPLRFLAENGSVLAVSDAGVSAAFLRAAASGAVMNVKINTRAMKDRACAEETDRRAEQLLISVINGADAVYDAVTEALEK